MIKLTVSCLVADTLVRILSSSDLKCRYEEERTGLISRFTIHAEKLEVEKLLLRWSNSIGSLLNTLGKTP